MLLPQDKSWRFERAKFIMVATGAPVRHRDKIRKVG